MTVRRCYVCDRWKLVDAFYANQRICIACKRARESSPYPDGSEWPAIDNPTPTKPPGYCTIGDCWHPATAATYPAGADGTPGLCARHNAYYHLSDEAKGRHRCTGCGCDLAPRGRLAVERGTCWWCYEAAVRQRCVKLRAAGVSVGLSGATLAILSGGTGGWLGFMHAPGGDGAREAGDGE